MDAARRRDIVEEHPPGRIIEAGRFCLLMGFAVGPTRAQSRRVPGPHRAPSPERFAMETSRIAQILDEMGALLEVRGENPFRCRAYHNAAQALKGLPADLTELITDGRLAEVPGIGETMHSKIVRLATTGHLPAYDELRRETPPGLVPLLRVPGLGPKKIKLLHETLKVESLADLRAAGEAGKIAGLKGFGARTEAKILEGIRFVESVGDRILQVQTRRLVAPVPAAIRAHPSGSRGEDSGSLPRPTQTIGDPGPPLTPHHPA